MGNAQSQQGFSQPDGVALREHLEDKIKSLAFYFEARLASMEKALELASTRLHERLAGMNEFQGAMNDLAHRMVTKAEFSLQMDRIADEIAELKKFRDRLEGVASQKSVTTAQMLAAAGLLLSILALIVNELT
jgi:hypothetical protein